MDIKCIPNTTKTPIIKLLFITKFSEKNKPINNDRMNEANSAHF